MVFTGDKVNKDTMLHYQEALVLEVKTILDEMGFPEDSKFRAALEAMGVNEPKTATVEKNAEGNIICKETLDGPELTVENLINKMEGEESIQASL